MARKKQLTKADRPVSAVSGRDLPTSYPELLTAVKHRISQSRIRAALSVNWELTQLYWEIGRLIVETISQLTAAGATLERDPRKLIQTATEKALEV